MTRNIAVDYIVTLLNRAEPRPVVSYFAEGNTTIYECPQCRSELGSDDDFDIHYCSYCGQALDW